MSRQLPGINHSATLFQMRDGRVWPDHQNSLSRLYESHGVVISGAGQAIDSSIDQIASPFSNGINGVCSPRMQFRGVTLHRDGPEDVKIVVSYSSDHRTEAA